MYAIKVHNLSKTYKNGIQALSGLNIQVSLVKFIRYWEKMELENLH